MAVLRILAISVVAAFAACAVASLVLFGSVDRGSFIPLMFALPASILLLASAYAALKERGTPLGRRYLALVGLGLVGGALMLGTISPANVLIGSFYGGVTALCWVVLHALTRPRSPADLKA